MSVYVERGSDAEYNTLTFYISKTPNDDMLNHSLKLTPISYVQVSSINEMAPKKFQEKIAESLWSLYPWRIHILFFTLAWALVEVILIGPKKTNVVSWRSDSSNTDQRTDPLQSLANHFGILHPLFYWLFWSLTSIPFIQFCFLQSILKINNFYYEKGCVSQDFFILVKRYAFPFSAVFLFFIYIAFMSDSAFNDWSIYLYTIAETFGDKQVLISGNFYKLFAFLLIFSLFTLPTLIYSSFKKLYPNSSLKRKLFFAIISIFVSISIIIVFAGILMKISFLCPKCRPTKGITSHKFWILWPNLLFALSVYTILLKYHKKE